MVSSTSSSEFARACWGAVPPRSKGLLRKKIGMWGIIFFFFVRERGERKREGARRGASFRFMAGSPSPSFLERCACAKSRVISLSLLFPHSHFCSFSHNPSPPPSWNCQPCVKNCQVSFRGGKEGGNGFEGPPTVS